MNPMLKSPHCNNI